MRVSHVIVKRPIAFRVAIAVLCLILIYLLTERHKAVNLELEERLLLSRLGCGKLPQEHRKMENPSNGPSATVAESGVICRAFGVALRGVEQSTIQGYFGLE